MKPSSVFLHLTIVFVALCGWQATAQEASDDPVAAPPARLSAEDVQARLQGLQAAEDLDEATRTKIVDLYQQVLSELKLAAQHDVQIAEFEQRIAAVPERRSRTRSQLESLPEKTSIEVAPDTTLTQLETELQTKEAELGEAKKELAQLESEPKRRAERRTELPKLISAARQRLAELEGSGPPPADEPPKLSEARATLRRARALTLQQEITSAEREMGVYETSVELLPLRRDLSKRACRLIEVEIGQWQELVSRRRQSEVAQQSRNAAQAIDRVPPLLRSVAEENLELAAERKEIHLQIKQIRARRDRSANQLEALDDQLQRVRAQERAIGPTGALGALLRKHRQALPSAGTLRRDYAARRQQIGDVQYRLIELEDQRSAVADLDQRVDLLLDSIDDREVQRDPGVAATARELLVARRDALDGLLTDHNTAFEALLALDTAEQELIDLTGHYAQYIDERVLWIRSTDPVAWSDATAASQAVAEYLRPQVWLDVARQLLAEVATRPLFSSLVIGSLAVLGLIRRRLRRVLQAAGQQAQSSGCHSFLPTGVALACSLLLASFWPAVLGYLAWRLGGRTEGNSLAAALPLGLFTAAVVLLPLEFWRQAASPGGLSEAHFGRCADSLRPLRRSLSWLIGAALPLVTIVATVSAADSHRPQAALGRVALCGLMMVAAIFLIRFLRPTGAVVGAALAARRGGWLDRTRFVWYPAGVGIPLILAGLSIAGFHYTAREMALRLEITMVLLLAIHLASAILLRWMLVSQRRVAAAQARVRLAEAGAAGGDPSASRLGLASEVAGTAAARGQLLDLSQVDLQTRRLLRSFAWLAGLVGTCLIWADVVPAFGILEHVPLWDREVTQTVVAADGNAETVTRLEPVSLRHAAVSLLVFLMTIVAIKNVPGLLEIAVLQRLPLDAALRFAITTVTRYALILIGLAWALGNIGWGWSRIQWLIAAVSVGLGFGLQEIFANFISGLIILFERPLRAGDIVTLGNTTGKVLQVRTRATVIQDWDRKELIVPNKEFITGRLLNWTLSDHVNRLVVTVGVAYGSDVLRVREMIMQIATDHPLVLGDPAPSVTLDMFQDSALQFTLRAYLPDLENRLAVTHDLHASIYQKLNEAGIEIAFPQRDLRLRSADESLAVMRLDHPAADGTSTSFTRRSA